MKLRLSDNNGLHIWWYNFIYSLIVPDMEPPKDKDEFHKLIQDELARYGGSMKLPYKEIEFNDEAKAIWFILRWS